MRICDCKHPLLSLTIVVLPSQLQDKREAEAEARRKSSAGETLTKKEAKFIARYSYQAPCYSLARSWSLVRQLEHAHL